jgi:alkanesulfonate monooxygenase SsuD/methylene tetrahydromethanopterin reductase-like flavin-dependent oxidoreductase (luciferase family)
MTSSDAIRFGFMGGTADFKGPAADASWARLAEGLGADLIATGESPVQFYDPYVTLHSFALNTERVMLGTLVTTPGLRHPAVLACTMMTLQKITGGRIFLGMGVGDLALIQMGEKPYGLEAFADYATAVRDLCAGREATWNGRPLEMRLESDPVPVWFGADGPKGIPQAGRLADGIVVAQAGVPSIVRSVEERAAAGAAEAGRSREELEIWYMLRALITDEPGGAIDIDGLDEYASRGAFYLWRSSGKAELADFRARLLERKGLEVTDDIAERLWRYAQEFDESRSWGSKFNVELMDTYGIRDWTADTFFVSGPPDYVRRRVEELIAAGARNFVTPFMAGDRETSAREVAAVLTSLR